jgi:hypothetical protein
VNPENVHPESEEEVWVAAAAAVIAMMASHNIKPEHTAHMTNAMSHHRLALVKDVDKYEDVPHSEVVALSTKVINYAAEHYSPSAIARRARLPQEQEDA